MALSGKLDADFSDFYSACQRATVELKSFDTATKNVETTLGRMTDEFSGRKILTEAALMVEAVERVGGVSNLTEKELARIGSTATEAAEKLRALGQEVPAGLQKIAEAAQNSGKQTSFFEGVLKVATGTLGAFGIGLSVEALINFGKEILTNADALVKLSDRTGISIQSLQQLRVAGDDAGNTLDELTRAVNAMQNKIAGGDQSAAAALKTLGIEFANFKTLNPADQLIAVSDALRKVEDPAKQVALSMDLMGKAGVESLPTLKRGFDDVKDAATGMSTVSIRAIDAFGDKVGVGARWLKTQFGEAFADIVTLSLSDSRRMADAWESQIERVAKAVPKMPTIAITVAPGLPADLDEITKKFEEDAKVINEQASPAMQRFRDAMADLNLTGTGWVGVLDSIDGKVVEAIKYYLEAGVSQNTLAAAYQLTEQQIRSVTIAMANDVAGTDLATAAKKRQKEIIEEITRQTNEQVLAKFKASQADQEFADQELKAAQAAEEWFTKTAEGAEKTATATDKATQATGVYMNQLHMLVSDPMLAGFFDSSGIGATLYGGGKSGLTPEEAAAMAAGQFIQRSGVGNVARLPGRAGGGPVSAGMPYIVGERGPELFVPGQGGQIATGGGAVAAVTNHIYVNGTAEEVARKVSAEILRTVMAGTKVR